MSDIITDAQAKIAEEARTSFEIASRENGDKFWRKKEDAPEWVYVMSLDAHKGMLPDDWRYQFIVNALDSFSECAGEDWDDVIAERADSDTSVYNIELLDWLGSHGDRAGYVDEASKERDFIAEPGIMHRIMLGQYAERTEVYQSVRRSIEDRAEGIENESEAA